MNKFVSIQEAAKFLGVSTQTLRRWENEGKEIAVERTKGNQRRYDLSKMRPLATGADKLSKGITLAYARVSSHDQKEDLHIHLPVERPILGLIQSLGIELF